MKKTHAHIDVLFGTVAVAASASSVAQPIAFDVRDEVGNGNDNH